MAETVFLYRAKFNAVGTTALGGRCCHSSIYKKDRFVFYVNVVNKSICIAPVGALMG